MEIKKCVYKSILLLLLSPVFTSCITNNDNKDKLVIQVGDTINLMLNSVIRYNQQDSLFSNNDFKFRIITYGNAYCRPCWEKILKWKEYLPRFQKFSQVTFLCYVYASPKDFDELNNEAKLNFPVLLDTKERFRIVNRLSNIPEDLTFLVNKDNKVLCIGPPFTDKKYKEYIKIIQGE